MTIEEAYEKYKHLDGLLSNRELATDDFRMHAICDMWEAIKQYQEKKEAYGLHTSN